MKSGSVHSELGYPMFDKFRNIVQMTTRGLSYVGMAFIFPMMLLTSTDAAGRDLFSRPVRGAFEV